MMESDKKENSIYKLPMGEKLDGLNLPTTACDVVFKGRLDDKRLRADEDTLIATYPRTGTTWLSQILSLLVCGEENFERKHKTPLADRVPYLELRTSAEPPINRMDDFPVPRIDKTHLPFRFIRRWIEEDKLPTIVTTRHPKDTLVSLFHFYKNIVGFDFDGTWKDFFEHFQAGYVMYGDQFHWYQDWASNKQDNILFVKFEDMKEDIEKEIRKIVHFLNIHASDDFIKKLIDISSLEHMKQDKCTNFKDSKHINLVKGADFIQKGKSGEWKKYFTVAQNEWFDSVYKDAYNKLDLDVEYD